MTHLSQTDLGTEPIQLAAGERLCEAGSQDGLGWQLLSGALRLDQGGSGRERLVQLALPGDLVGLEPLCGLPRQVSAIALVDCCVRELLPSEAGQDGAVARLLATALTQQWQRAADMSGLRTGPTPERVRRLMLMLQSRPGDDADAGPLPTAHPHALPRIKDIAALVDSAHETVSRILSGLRRLQVLDERHTQFARFDRQRLDDCLLPKGMTRSSPWVRAPHLITSTADG